MHIHAVRNITVLLGGSDRDRKLRQKPKRDCRKRWSRTIRNRQRKILAKRPKGVFVGYSENPRKSIQKTASGRNEYHRL